MALLLAQGWRAVAADAVAPPRATVQALDGPASGSFFGHTAAGAGDVNRDGYADIIVGAYGGHRGTGAVHVYFGSRTGVPSQPSWSFHAGQSGEFGHQVEGVGDVNGDGVDDFIVGATHWGGPPPKDVGAAFVFHGATNGLPDQPAWVVHGEASGCMFGFSVAAAGDLNRDGFMDVLVGAPALLNARPDGQRATRGRIFLYLGGPGGLQTNAAWTAIGEQQGSSFGYSLHGAGDVNGDGCADIVVGDFMYSDHREWVGRVYLFLGGSNGPAAEPSWTYTGNQARMSLGISVFTAGDVNRDGYADVIVAANHWSNQQADEGRLLVFLGSSNGLPQEPSWAFEPDHRRMVLGHSVATAGDVNGDGHSDIIAGAFYGENGEWEEGLAFLFHGSPLGPSRWPDWSARGVQGKSGFGATVRAAGDVDGDGLGDVVIGHTHFSGKLANQGRVSIYYGSSNGLAGSIHWQPPGRKIGFEVKSLPVPVPNLVWTAALTLLAVSLLGWVLLRLHRRGLRRALALQAEREAAREAERRRLARDLHDHLGPDLLLAGGAAAPLRARVTELVWLTKPANDSLPNVADFLGHYAAERAAAAGLRADLDFPPGLPPRVVPGELRRDLFLAFKEALANALKHAQASELAVKLTLHGDLLELTVRDNGRGFDPGQVQATPGHGNGLPNLRSRLREHGGTCEIHSAPGQGARVVFRVRLPK